MPFPRFALTQERRAAFIIPLIVRSGRFRIAAHQNPEYEDSMRIDRITETISQLMGGSQAGSGRSVFTGRYVLAEHRQMTPSQSSISLRPRSAPAASASARVFHTCRDVPLLEARVNKRR
jgi:hypothetical protein